jgi:predicted nuclease with TOPRIM domain
MKLKIKEDISLHRDSISGAVINTNDSLYQSRLEQIKNAKIKEQEKEDLHKELDTLKSDVNEIKDLLKSLLASNE